MSNGQGPQALYFIILLVMVGSSVAALRIPMGKALRMAPVSYTHLTLPTICSV